MAAKRHVVFMVGYVALGRAFGLVAIPLIGGCFSANGLEGVACGPEGLCPDGLTCDVDLVCRRKPLPPIEKAVPTSGTFEVYFDDFDDGLRLHPGIRATLAGADTRLVSVEGFSDFGFSDMFARNDSSVSEPTTLRLENLPPHESVSIGSLLAILDSWDGTTEHGPDFLNVSVDGTSIFSYVMCRCDGTPENYGPPLGGELVYQQYLAVTEINQDDGYDLGVDPTFQNIPHTASSLEVAFWATGPHWTGVSDESFAIENLRILLTHSE
jgi:hypothetical protein